MVVLFSQIKTLDGLQKDSLPLQSIPPPPVPPAPPSSSSSSSRISPAVLFIIVILAVIFFVSGLLHLLVRFFIKKSPSSSSSRPNRQSSTGGGEISGSDALQRQLQQLFHLHDSGLDQAFIDALPVFLYRELIGSKEPFDCAVCLCEFSGDDKLRLLPICGHAFHLACIDTWLLSNSTCPLCRGALFVPGLAIENPIFDLDDPAAAEEGALEASLKPGEVFPVRLGKFRRLSNGESDGSESNHDQNKGNNGRLRREEGESSSSNLDARRCYSMGSYQYVVGDANLRVALGSGSAIRRKGRGLVGSSNHNPPSIVEDGGMEGKRLGIASKGESFSVSKIWLWSNKKGKLPGSAADDAAASLDGGLPWMRT